ncbi:MAG: phosphoglycerate mutase, partial [Muribaculaceae bacterium]
RGADFVFLHVEASDEAGHEGDVSLKVKTIESLDGVCGKILESLPSIGEPVAIAVLPDHPTPCAKRTHSATPVPVMIYTPGVKGDGLERYDEMTAKTGSLGEMSGDEFIKIFLEK